MNLDERITLNPDVLTGKPVIPGGESFPVVGPTHYLRRSPETKRCEAGSLAEIWRELAGITVAKLEIHGKTHLKLSSITPYARKLLTLCHVPSLETLLSE